MKRRGIRAAISLVAVAVCYTAYARLVVPLIEPSADSSARDLGQLEPLSDLILDARLAELAPLFPHRAEMLKNSKLLESDQVKLLLQDYRNLGDGRVLIRPCILVMYPDRAMQDGDPQRPQQVIVLEAPEGALFQFDRPFQLGLGRMGRFVSGHLQGSVVLRSAGGSPTEENAIRVTTRDVTITERRIWTTQPVEFSWGRNRGRGSGMELVLAGGSSLSQVTDSGWHSLGLERFVLRHVDRLHLESRTSQANAQARGAKQAGEDYHIVEAACQGPLFFFPQQGTLTLQEEVNVSFRRGDNPASRLTCDQLTVFVTKPPSSRSQSSPPPKAVASPQPRPSQAPGWRVEGAVATGTPALITFGPWAAEMRCDTLRYDATHQIVEAVAQRGVEFTRSGSHLRAPAVRGQWTDGPNGPLLTRAVAEGSGELRFSVPSRDGGFVTAAWRRQLSIQREGEELVAWMSEGSQVHSTWGDLTGNELWLWLAQSAASKNTAEPTPAEPILAPRRMLVRGDVALRSPQLDADVLELQAWFVPFPAIPVAGQPTNPPAVGAIPAASLHASAKGSGNRSHYRTAGRVLRAEIALASATAVLNAVSMDGNVQIEEDATPSPDLLPIRLHAEHVELTDVSGPTLMLSMTGNPAHLEGRGFGLSGNQIFFEQSRNLLSVAGPGGMRLPRREGATSGGMGFLDLTWEEGMSFDGRTVSVRGNVRGSSPPQRVFARSIEARLRETVFLGALETVHQPQLASLFAEGNVRLENERLDEQGRLVTLDMLELPQVELDMVSGAIDAPGPGLLRTLRLPSMLSAAMLPMDSGGGSVTEQDAPRHNSIPESASSPGNSASGISALIVRFQQALRGNLLQREIVCMGWVTVKYGSAPSWEVADLPSDPAKLGPSGMILECRELTARQIPDPATGRPHLEMEARGNVTAEGTTYTARADRVSLNEAKTLLILEGGSQAAAQLFRQEYPGGPIQKTAARRILYWYATRTVKIDGAQSLELSGFPESDAFSR